MNIYLSPHLDDACFSVGYLASLKGGALVNVFTVSDYVAAPMALPADRADRIGFVSGLRRSEDLKFADATGLTRYDLGLSEPPVLGRGPFDLTGMAEEVRELSVTLARFLLGLLPDGDGAEGRNSLYCPMGIGGHRNHLAMLGAVRQAYGVLSPRCDVYLYEDLHYASNPKARRDGLAFAARLFSDVRLLPTVVPLDPVAAERKLRWIGMYASQHAAPPRLTEFTPASGLAPGPHEIVWRLAELSRPQA